MLKSNRQHDLVVLGFDISHWSPLYQFLLCFFGLFFCFLLYGVCQEEIMSRWKAHNLHLGWFLTMIQCAFYSLFTFLFSSSPPALLQKDSPSQSKSSNKLMVSFILIGTLSMITIGLSNTAIEYVSYPTQVAFKSSKPIPVMFAGIFILKKHYAWSEYIAVFCLCAGLYLFTVAEQESFSSNILLSSTGKLEQPSMGFLLLCVALIVDGVIGNVQQKTFEGVTNIHPSEMIMKTKGVAALEAFLICAVQGQLFVAMEFFIEFPSAILPVLVYCLTGVLGESFVMSLIKRFGALSAVISTSVRKAFTMVISFFVFARPWTPTYFLAAMLVWLGVSLHIASEYGDVFAKRANVKNAL